MIKIIRFREFTPRDLQFVVFIKPFEDAGLVEDLPHDPKAEMDLLFDICKDGAGSNYHFDHILCKTNTHETPSTLYRHLVARDNVIPTLCYYHEKDGKRRDIKAITTYQELQSLLGTASGRGYVNGADHLV